MHNTGLDLCIHELLMSHGNCFILQVDSAYTRKLYILLSFFLVYILLSFHIKCRFRKKISLQNKCRFRFSMQNLLILCKIYFSIGLNIVRCIGNGIFYRKCTKLIVYLIRMPKLKTTLIIKQRDYQRIRLYYMIIEWSNKMFLILVYQEHNV